MIYYAEVAGSKCPRCGYGTIKTAFLCNPCQKAAYETLIYEHRALGPRPPAPKGIEVKYGKDRQ